MDGVDNETWFAKIQVPKKPYSKLGFKSTMASYGI
jgi:hypothetical protein